MSYYPMLNMFSPWSSHFAAAYPKFANYDMSGYGGRSRNYGRHYARRPAYYNSDYITQPLYYDNNYVTESYYDDVNAARAARKERRNNRYNRVGEFFEVLNPQLDNINYGLQNIQSMNQMNAQNLNQMWAQQLNPGLNAGLF